MKYLRPSAGISGAELEDLEKKLDIFYRDPPPAYHAGTISGNEDWSDSAHELHRRITACAFRGAKVVDVGCGAATPAPRFMEAGACYTGLDISAQQIAANRIAYPVAEFVILDWKSLPALGRTFDIVTSFFVLEHIARPKEFLAASASIVRPGRFLAVLCPDYLQRGFMPSQHFFGGRPGGLRNKLRSLDVAEVLRTAADKYFFYPTLLRRARLAVRSGGAWLINLRPMCLDVRAWATDWDAVYMVGEEEVIAEISRLGFKMIERGRDIDGGRHGYCYALARKL